MKYTKQVSIVGNWVKSADLKSGMRARITSETSPVPSQFQNKDGSMKNQDVCKVKFEGFQEEFNVALNRATINGLLEAFGDDSLNWQNKTLMVETEKMRVAGKAVVALYLIPEGYERIDDANGYALIVKKGTLMQKQEIAGMPQADEVEDINNELAENKVNEADLPF